MIDELDALRRFRDDVPGPTDEARRRAAAAVAARAGTEDRLRGGGTGRRRHRRRLVVGAAAAVLVAACAAAAVVVPRSSAPTTTIRYRAAAPSGDTGAALVRTAGVLRERAGALGLSHPRVAVTGDEIGVSIDAHQATPAVLDAIGADATLYLRPVLCGVPAHQPGGTATATAPPTCPAGSSPPDGTGVDLPSSPALSAEPTTTPAEDRQHPASTVVLAAPPGAPAPRYLLGPVVADGSLIRQAHAARSSTGLWNVVLTLTASGVRQFDALGADDPGRAIAFDYDGTIITAPVLEARSFASGVEISGSFTEETARALAVDLTYGALPVALRT